MGLFSSIRDRMNEEFVIRAHNVRRYEEDPEILDEILPSSMRAASGRSVGCVSTNGRRPPRGRAP